MKVLVVGMGEVGRPIAELLSQEFQVECLDREPKPINGRPHVVHICYPYEIDDFVGTTVDYLDRFKPDLAIINSTVGIGTTREITNRSGGPVVHSPVRGKHRKMLEDLRRYTKYVGAVRSEDAVKAAEHFHVLGLTTRILSSPEAAELAKLSETTYFGLLIAWAQELERYCLQFGLDYDEVASFYDEIPFFPPVRYFPGVIGGHCVMPNIDILRESFGSSILEAIECSNRMKILREQVRETELELPEVQIRGDHKRVVRCE